MKAGAIEVWHQFEAIALDPNPAYRSELQNCQDLAISKRDVESLIEGHRLEVVRTRPEDKPLGRSSCRPGLESESSCKMLLGNKIV